jgi:hypothetical protein
MSDGSLRVPERMFPFICPGGFFHSRFHLPDMPRKASEYIYIYSGSCRTHSILLHSTKLRYQARERILTSDSMSIRDKGSVGENPNPTNASASRVNRKRAVRGGTMGMSGPHMDRTSSCSCSCRMYEKTFMRFRPTSQTDGITKILSHLLIPPSLCWQMLPRYKR